MLNDMYELTNLMHTQGAFYLAYAFWVFMGLLFLIYLAGGIAGMVHFFHLASRRPSARQINPRSADSHSNEHGRAA